MPTFKELAIHYKSPYWNMVRGKLLYERRGRCERCKSPKRLEAHHLNYKYFRTELSHLDTLQLLCHDCHVSVTKKIRAKRKKRIGVARRITRFLLS